MAPRGGPAPPPVCQGRCGERARDDPLTPGHHLRPMVCCRCDRMPPRLSTRTALLLASLAFVAPAAAQAPRPLKLRFPRTVIEARRNVEACVFVRLPATEPFDLASWQITQQGF